MIWVLPFKHLNLTTDNWADHVVRDRDDREMAYHVDAHYNSCACVRFSEPALRKEALLVLSGGGWPYRRPVWRAEDHLRYNVTQRGRSCRCFHIYNKTEHIFFSHDILFLFDIQKQFFTKTLQGIVPLFLCSFVNNHVVYMGCLYCICGSYYKADMLTFW